MLSQQTFATVFGVTAVAYHRVFCLEFDESLAVLVGTHSDGGVYSCEIESLDLSVFLLYSDGQAFEKLSLDIN